MYQQLKTFLMYDGTTDNSLYLVSELGFQNCIIETYVLKIENGNETRITVHDLKQFESCVRLHQTTLGGLERE